MVAGTQYVPFGGQPGRIWKYMIRGGLYFFVYAVALFFYLFSWDEIGPGGIIQRVPWGRRSHSFDEIASLEMIPAKMRSDELVRDGPWHRVWFTDGRDFTFAHDNEGCTEADLVATARFIAKRSGKRWAVVRGAIAN